MREAELSMERRLGADEHDMLIVQCNLARAYRALGRHKEARRWNRDVYSGLLRILGEEHQDTICAANNYAGNLSKLRRYQEAKSLLR